MPPSLTCYVPIARLRKRQGVDSTDTVDDAYWLTKLRTASNEIDNAVARSFWPVLETRKFDYTSSRKIEFRSQTLLSSPNDPAPFGAIVVDGTQATIVTSSIIPLGVENDAKGPYYAFEIDPTRSVVMYLTTRTRAISVTGVWGYHTDWANAFHDSGVTVQDNPLASNSTTITTSRNDGTVYDAWGQNWLDGTVQSGHLIQIGNEWMCVVQQISATQIKVVRAVNGTSAASHGQGSTISVYEAPQAIQEAAVLYAAFLIARDGADFSKTVIPELGQTIVPSGPPADYYKKLQPFIKLRVA